MKAEQEQAMIRYWLKENQPAIDLVNAYCRISQIWDDLHDGDQSVYHHDVDNMMKMALVDIPTNPFFQQHYLELMPVIQHLLLNWMEANTLEVIGDERDLQVSYIIRSVTTDLIIFVAGIVGGMSWRTQAALAVRQAIYHDNEDFISYSSEILARRVKPKEDEDVQQQS